MTEGAIRGSEEIGSLREWYLLHSGHEIQVLLRWWLRAELYVDGRLQDSRSLLVRGHGVPLLTGRLPTSPLGAGLLHVFAGPVWSSVLEIQIGTRIVRLKAPMQAATLGRQLFRRGRRVFNGSQGT